MKINFNQLNGHLQRKLASIYVVAGDEPLSVMEAQDAIRARAREQGYTGRERFEVTRSFDWDELLAASDSLSLFAEQRILELHMPTGKPGDAGGKALRRLAAAPPPDTLLLVVCGKLESNTPKTKWFTELTGAGVYVPVWPVELKDLPGWIDRRMARLGMKPDADAAELLAERVEGNLLACAQEIDKLFLMCGKGPVSLDDILESVADSARFDVFRLADAALAGDAGRAVRILDGLRDEGVDAVPVLWSLTREVRALGLMAGQMAAGQALPAVLAAARVWDKRKDAVGRALQRHRVPAWQGFLADCGRIDRACKGQRAGSPWDELLQLTLEISGAPGQFPRPATGI